MLLNLYGMFYHLYVLLLIEVKLQELLVLMDGVEKEFRCLLNRLKSLKFKVVEEGFKFKFVPNEEELKKADEFVDKFLELNVNNIIKNHICR